MKFNFLFLIFFLVTSCSFTNRTVKDSYSENIFVHKGLNESGRDLSSYISTSKVGMVVSEGEPATQIAYDVLKNGGSAVDAAIALSFAISVYRPHSTGIGGGGFLLYYSKSENKTYVLDMRERAPYKASRDMYLDKNGKPKGEASQTGGLAVGTPGLVAGLWELYDNYGSKKIKWKELVLPSVKLAKEGFEVYPSLDGALKSADKRLKGKLDFKYTKKLIYDKNGKLLSKGDIYKNPYLANTLEAIAKKGKKGFYNGWVAYELVRSTQKHGGVLQFRDLRDYKVKWRKAVTGEYKGFKIVSMPPPSSGGVHVIQMLNIFEQLDLAKFPFFSTDAIHYKAETMRRAYADRSLHLGDPDFYDVPVEGLISKEYAKYLSQGISPVRAQPSQSEVKPGEPHKFKNSSTTHFSIIDSAGNVVSSTQTINTYFGSLLVAGKSGVFLNNEMDDFSIKPGVPNAYGLVGGEANSIKPKKTPLSSMTPTIVFNNKKPFLVLGSPGGSRIITSVLNVIVNVIDHGMNLQDAVFAPRFHHQWLPDRLFTDDRDLPNSIIASLKKRGHVIESTDGVIGNVSAIHYDEKTKTYTGVADPRREGKPLGL